MNLHLDYKIKRWNKSKKGHGRQLHSVDVLTDFINIPMLSQIILHLKTSSDKALTLVLISKINSSKGNSPWDLES